MDPEELNEEGNEQTEETPAAPEPVDIAEAFKMYNTSQREAAQAPVEDSNTGDGAEEPVDAIGEEGLGSGDSRVADYSAAEPSVDGDDGADDGGSPAVIEPIDINPARQNLLKSIQQGAIQAARKELADQQIERWSLNDIYERNEETGEVTFHNPDDPRRPFQSRAEAQAFIDAMNKGVEEAFRNTVNQKQQELLQASAPTLRLLEFAPTYQGLDETTRGVFDDLVEPYAVKNNAGKVIGFNVNLNSVLNTARQVSKRFTKSANPGTTTQAGQAKRASEKQGSTPAMDMPTGKSESTAGEEKEPKTLGEALKMYDQANRKGKK